MKSKTLFGSDFKRIIAVYERKNTSPLGYSRMEPQIKLTTAAVWIDKKNHREGNAHGGNPVTSGYSCVFHVLKKLHIVVRGCKLHVYELDKYF